MQDSGIEACRTLIRKRASNSVMPAPEFHPHASFTRQHGAATQRLPLRHQRDRLYVHLEQLTHNLTGRHERYDRSGCVNCGHCISCCPAGFNITEEVAALCTLPA